MLCSKCHKNEASVYYKQNINGEVREYALCPECAKEINGESFGGLDAFNLFGSLFSGGTQYPKISRKRCNLCNSTFEDIRNSGKVGCAHCYETFHDELEGMIQNIHGNVKHIGRAPGELGEKRKEENLKNTLREQLAEAIANEEYEKAAMIRDKIKEMGGEAK